MPRQDSQADKELVATEAVLSRNKRAEAMNKVVKNEVRVIQAPSSAAAKNIIEHKRTLAKTVPQLPTFQPKISRNSSKIVQQMIKKRFET